jgi:ribosomal protein S18 acetylase RimI-like enzyme
MPAADHLAADHLAADHLAADALTLRRARLADRDALVAFNAAMAEETEGKTLDRAVLRAGVEAVLVDGDARRGFYLVAETPAADDTDGGGADSGGADGGGADGGGADGADDAALVGALLVTTEWSDWRNGRFWWIQSVYVRPAWRRRGVLRALYARVEAEARRAADVVGLRLYVEQANDAARRAYDALGMTETSYRFYETDFTT